MKQRVAERNSFMLAAAVTFGCVWTSCRCAGTLFQVTGRPSDTFPSFCISVAVQEGSKEQEGWSLLGDVLLEQELIS